jgi:hypothetical protein
MKLAGIGLAVAATLAATTALAQRFEPGPARSRKPEGDRCGGAYA